MPRSLAIVEIGASPVRARATAWDRRAGRAEVVARKVRRHMLLRAVQDAAFVAETGVAGAAVRFAGWQARVAQRLFFRQGLDRRPVSLRAYRWIWPRLSQRRFLMPLVRPQGIYCFYSAELVVRLAALVGDRPAVEIAAGDGTLARFLRERGVDVVATDDHSWSDAVRYPEDVVREDARTSLRTRAPRVVICSWPPVGNTFERAVFTTPSVETYVVIGSASEQGTGAWADYRRQDAFDWAPDPELTRLVLPHENGNQVLVFQRR